MNAIDNAVKNSLSGRLPVIIFIMSVLLGLMALKQTPREEEPQIVVPMLDIYVAAPNVEAPEVARLVTEPLEKLLAQLTGVEHIYSTTQSNAAVVLLLLLFALKLVTTVSKPFSTLTLNSIAINTRWRQ